MSYLHHIYRPGKTHLNSSSRNADKIDGNCSRFYHNLKIQIYKSFLNLHTKRCFQSKKVMSEPYGAIAGRHFRTQLLSCRIKPLRQTRQTRK